MSLFCCPLCAAPLEQRTRTYTCPRGHSFDRAREGGWYAPLREALCRLALTKAPASPVLLDAGCGEGYYTQGVAETLRASGGALRAAGVDLSRPSLRRAARRAPEVEFAAASVYHLPVADASVDLLLDCFSPLALEEFCRVLRPGGVFLYVVPGARHLWELKEVLYDRPYLNREEEVPYPGFRYVEVVPVEGRMDLDRAALGDLFAMTPYRWKTPRAGAARLEALEGLGVTAAFRVHVFRRV